RFETASETESARPSAHQPSRRRQLSVWSRIRMLFNAAVSSARDSAEDPRTVLDYAYNQQQELLITLRRGLVDVATAKEQLEQEGTRLHTPVPRLSDQR